MSRRESMWRNKRVHKWSPAFIESLSATQSANHTETLFKVLCLTYILNRSVINGSVMTWACLWMGLLWTWSVMNVVCYERNLWWTGLLWMSLLWTWSVMNGLFWTGLLWTDTIKNVWELSKKMFFKECNHQGHIVSLWKTITDTLFNWVKLSGTSFWIVEKFSNGWFHWTKCENEYIPLLVSM